MGKTTTATQEYTSPCIRLPTSAEIPVNNKRCIVRKPVVLVFDYVQQKHVLYSNKKMPRDLKFGIYEEEGMNCLCIKTKALICNNTRKSNLQLSP